MAMYDDELSQKIIKWLRDNHKEKIAPIFNSETLHTVASELENNFVTSVNYWTKEDKRQLAGQTLTTDLQLFTSKGQAYFIRLVELAKQ